MLPTGGVYLLSPLLHTLMRTISEDTVIALTAFLLAGHLYLNDYSFVNSVTDKLTGAVSLGAAVFASVLIASGMPTELDVVRARGGPSRGRGRRSTPGRPLPPPAARFHPASARAGLHI